MPLTSEWMRGVRDCLALSRPDPSPWAVLCAAIQCSKEADRPEIVRVFEELYPEWPGKVKLKKHQREDLER